MLEIPLADNHREANEEEPPNVVPTLELETPASAAIPGLPKRVSETDPVLAGLLLREPLATSVGKLKLTHDETVPPVRSLVAVARTSPQINRLPPLATLPVRADSEDHDVAAELEGAATRAREEKPDLAPQPAPTRLTQTEPLEGAFTATTLERPTLSHVKLALKLLRRLVTVTRISCCKR